MSSLVVSPPIAAIFNSLTPRPPTPPREANRQPDYPLSTELYDTRHASHPGQSLQTPPNAHSPTPSNASGSGGSLSRARKRVEWATQSETIAAGQHSRHPGALAAAHYLPSPSSASSKPIRGILKPASSTSPLVASWGIYPDTSLSSANMVDMLDSTIRQLAGQDRDMKLDAYMLLTRALKASDNLPDRVALKDKMSLFVHFIQRDVCAKFDDDTSDTSLANHALNFLTTMLHLPAIASTLTSDFGRFILDLAIRLLEDSNTQKDLARSLMKVIVVQNFSAKVVTTDRIGRLLDALPKMDDHLSGKSITLSRLYIYKRLLKQCPSCFMTHSHWFKIVFTDMLSTVKDIQAQAVILAVEAGWALRSNKMLFRRVADLLRASQDGETYVDFYIRRLQALLGDKPTAPIVPQIWSAVILYLKCPLAHWQYYKPWFSLIQSALNARDMPTKLAAHLAWNRYVQLSLIDSNLSSKSLDTLCLPYLNQLRRKTVSNKHDEASRLQEAVLGGICSLLYHALAQSDDENTPGVLWDVAVQPTITQLLSLSGSVTGNDTGDGMTKAARILAGLLDSATPRPALAPERAKDPAFLKPEDLRPINARWLRRNCEKVFECVGPILERNFLELADEGSSTHRLWQALVSSASVASAKEVKVSEDTMRFLACSLNLLSRIWRTGVTDERATKGVDVFLKCTERLIEHLVEGLSSLPFTERQLLENASGVLEPASASCARVDERSLQSGQSRTPLQHLFCLLCTIPPGHKDDGKLCALLTTVFHSLLGSKGKHREEATWELLRLLPEDGLTSYGPWFFAASSLQLEFGDGSVLSAKLSADQGSHLTLSRLAQKLLESGLKTPSISFNHWVKLYEGFSTKVSRHLGDAFHALLVVKPFAKALLDIIEGCSDGVSLKALQAVEILFRDVKCGYDDEQMKNARLEVFESPLDAVLESPETPLADLSKLGNSILKNFHEAGATTYSTSAIAPVIGGISKFLLCSFDRPYFAETLIALQPGLCLLLQDMRALNEPGFKNLGVSDTIWEPVCRLFASASMPTEEDITRLKPLLKAAMDCKHASIATNATSIWAANCADKSPLPNPYKSQQVLAGSTHFEAERINATIDEGNGLIQTHTERAKKLSRGLPNTSPSTSSPSKIRRSSKSVMTAPSGGKSKRGLSEQAYFRAWKRSRLRHDDSQIQFESIAPQLLSQEESQHLTDHQKEVRERQRDSAVLYPVSQSSSPAGTRGSVNGPSTGAASPPGRTPRLGPGDDAFLDEMVTSTPTPRRGQIFSIGDVDEPLSPLLPRPCPLLSEIKARSTTDILENWQFSSPTGSPTAKFPTEGRVVDAEAEAAPSVPALSPAFKPQGAVPINNSSAAGDDDLSTKEVCLPVGGQTHLPEISTMVKGHAMLSQRAIPSPPSLRSTSRKRGALSGKMDAGKSPGESDLRQTFPPLHEDTQGSSCEQEEEGISQLNQRDDGSPSEPSSRLVSESVSVHASISNEEGCRGDVPGDVLRQSHHAQPQAPSSRCKRRAEEDNSLIRAETSMPGSFDISKDVKTRRPRPGKKRGGKKAGEGPTMRKRPRRDPQALDHNAMTENDLPRTRLQSKLKRAKQAEGERRSSTSKPEQPDDISEEDTDNELLSQLETDSIAASQQRSSSSPIHGRGEQVADAQRTTPENAVEARSAPAEEIPKAEQVPEQVNEECGPDSIRGMFRSSLDRLRGAALTRKVVYELEDLLMDMKHELFAAEKRGRQQQQQHMSVPSRGGASQ